MKISLFKVVFVAIFLAVIGIFVFSMAVNFQAYMTTDSFVGECVRKYEYHEGGKEGGTIFRVDVRRQGGEQIDTFNNQDDLLQGKYNSGTIHANLETGKWYKFDVRGRRSEFLSTYPNIISIEPVVIEEKDSGS